MKKVSNIFNKGLIMDVSPLSTTGDSLSDCLNGTFCTMNGDELVLQNDMGNGRVQTAYLPKGYIPIGTTQLGGIIYIASYNPFTNKCQIGSFPSPQRTSDKRDKLEKEIPLDKDENIIRVVLSDEIFKPGDKFYLTIPGQYMQYKYTESLPEIKVETENKSEAEIQAEIKKAKIAYVKNHFLKFSVAIISEEAQIIKLNEDPIIEESKNNTEDDFTKDINKFKVCTSKISGKLILIIERVTFDYSINFNAFSGVAVNSGNPTFYLNFNLNANSQNRFFPNRLVLESSAKYNDTSYGQTLTFPAEGEFTSSNFNDFHSFQYSAKNIYNNDVIDPVTATTVNRPGSSTDDTTISKLIERLTNSGYWNKVNNPVYLKILATLYTNNFKINSEGEKIGECLPAATKQYVIDLSKVASNTVELSRYTYTIVDGIPISAEITFELKTYLDSAYEIKNTTVNIYNVKDNSINKVGPGALEGNTVTFENLENNYLYLIEFQIKTGKIEAQDGNFDEKIINIYRYLYSNSNIVASFNKELTDYEQAVPTLTLEAKVIDEKLISDNPSSSEINYPHGLASTDNVTFTGTEKQIWEVAKQVTISITEKNNIPVEITSITANNKECDKGTGNTFKIDTGLQPQEKTFEYTYHTFSAGNTECNILERVSDYLYISNNVNDCETGYYPGRDRNSQFSYDNFNTGSGGGGGSPFNGSNFFKFYSGSSDTSVGEGEEQFYGYRKGLEKYRWVFIKFQRIEDTQGTISEYLPPNINTKPGTESNTYLIAPGNGGMLFTLQSEMSFGNLYKYTKEIFDILYTFRQNRHINIYFADSVSTRKVPDPIIIDKEIKVSNINIGLNTSNNELFTQLAEVYDRYYSKNNYKKPIISISGVHLSQTKTIEESHLKENYPIGVGPSNAILVKSNNILYNATDTSLSDNEIYFVTPSVDNVNIFRSVSDEYLNGKVTSEINYNGISKRFEAKDGRLYIKSVGWPYGVNLREGNTQRIHLPIKVEPTLN